MTSSTKPDGPEQAAEPGADPDPDRLRVFARMEVRERADDLVGVAAAVADQAVEAVELVALPPRTVVGAGLEGFNLLDRDDSDVEYFYASRLPGEPEEGIEDVHFHPVEKPSARLSASWRF